MTSDRSAQLRVLSVATDPFNHLVRLVALAVHHPPRSHMTPPSVPSPRLLSAAAARRQNPCVDRDIDVVLRARYLTGEHLQRLSSASCEFMNRLQIGAQRGDREADDVFPHVTPMSPNLTEGFRAAIRRRFNSPAIVPVAERPTCVMKNTIRQILLLCNHRQSRRFSIRT